MRVLLLSLVLATAASSSRAQLRHDLEVGAATVAVAGTGKAGTHENTLGLAAEARVRLPLGVRVRSALDVEALVEDLGIPGPNVGAQGALEVGYAFGDVRSGERAHHLGYYLVGYLDGDRTSQLSGGLRYQHTRDDGSLEVQFENDALAHQLLDRYRTFALRARVLRRDMAVPIGVGVRTVVWTGTTGGLGRLGRDEAYDLSGQYGGDVAHGILALDVYHGGLTLSLGVDSEAVRSTLQNSFHYLIDDGQIPRLDLAPRAFVRLALNEIGGLY